MEISENLTSFLYEHKTAINSCEFSTIYDDLINNYYPSDVSVRSVTDVFLAAGIYPIKHMTYVPSHYLNRCRITSEAKFEIPDHITRIGIRAFCDCELKEIAVPEGVTKIARSAFSQNPNMQKIWLPSTLEQLNGYLFLGNHNMKEIIYNGTVEQWENIDKHSHWFSSGASIEESNCIIYCKDARIVISTQEVIYG